MTARDAEQCSPAEQEYGQLYIYYYDKGTDFLFLSLRAPLKLITRIKGLMYLIKRNCEVGENRESKEQSRIVA